jgi:hypothetical protein
VCGHRRHVSDPDSWEVNDEEFASVLEQSAEKQLDYFVHKVADWETVWLLTVDGSSPAMLGENPAALAAWPHRRYAEACRVRAWADADAVFVDLDHFMDVVLREAEQQGHLVALLHSADTQQSLTISPTELQDALKNEREKYR